MANKLMYSPNDNTQNNTFCRLKWVVGTLEHLTYKLINLVKVAKVVNPMNKKMLS